MFNRKLHSSDGSASPRTRQPLIRHFPFQTQHLVMLHIAQLVLWQPKNMMTKNRKNKQWKYKETNYPLKILRPKMMIKTMENQTFQRRA